jgi:plastocyanin
MGNKKGVEPTEICVIKSSKTVDNTMKNLFSTLSLIVFTLISFGLQAQMSMEHAPTVIQLSQVKGAYTTTQLNLRPGDYVFEVTNTEVDKDLGFYLQDASGDALPNSGLQALVGNGETSRTGVVTLTEGSFQYSCPLNPTPHYRINVGTPRVISLSQREGVYETTGLNLAPGYYVFEVTNTSVDKDLGFYLQDAAGEQVKASGLQELIGNGETSRSGVVFLAAGEYEYSCPLNPTPHYRLKVE